MKLMLDTDICIYLISKILPPYSNGSSHIRSAISESPASPWQNSITASARADMPKNGPPSPSFSLPLLSQRSIEMPQLPMAGSVQR